MMMCWSGISLGFYDWTAVAVRWILRVSIKCWKRIVCRRPKQWFSKSWGRCVLLCIESSYLQDYTDVSRVCVVLSLITCIITERNESYQSLISGQHNFPLDFTMAASQWQICLYFLITCIQSIECMFLLFYCVYPVCTIQVFKHSAHYIFLLFTTILSFLYWESKWQDIRPKSCFLEKFNDC